MRSLCGVLFAALLAGGAFAESPGESARVDQLFKPWDKPDSPGCAVAVLKDGRVVHERGYGMADLEHDAKITPTSVFHVASISKQFTAAAVLLLAQEGKLSLDDEARRYVPELPDFGVPITLRHLLHHTSGLRDQWELLSISGWRYSLDLITDADVLSVVSRQRELNFPPGSKYLYSNTGYTLLAQIVKHVSGGTFREFTTERLFQPLAMHRTHFRDNHAEIVPDIAYGYEKIGDHFELSILNFDTVGATSLLTTVEDLALWDENFYTARVGGETLIRQLQEPGQLNDGSRIEYASGLVIGSYRGLATVDHAGGDAGYRSDMIRFPNQHFSAATLCNLASISPTALNRRIADIYLAGDFTGAPVLADDVAGVQQPAPDRLADIAGLYIDRDEGDRILRLHVEDGKLWAAGLVDKGYELKAIRRDRFRFLALSTELEIPVSHPGPQAALTAYVKGMKPLRFVRVAPYGADISRLREFIGGCRSDELEIPYETILESDHLVLRSLKVAMKLLPVEPDLFATEDFRIRFTRDSNGRIAGFVLNSDRTRDFRFHCAVR